MHRRRTTVSTTATLVAVLLLVAPLLGCKVLARPTAAAPIRAAFYYP